MPNTKLESDSPLLSYLIATAEQLDITVEDAEISLYQVIETFEAAANCMEELEHTLNHPDEFDRHQLLEVTTKLRKMLKTSVVSLQFQDRLSQRLALASREIRKLVADRTVNFEIPAENLQVPKSISSLYTPSQMARIMDAAGDPDVFQNAGPPPVASEDGDDITLF